MTAISQMIGPPLARLDVRNLNTITTCWNPGVSTPGGRQCTNTMHAVAKSDEYSQPTLELSRTFEGWWLPERALCCDDPFVAVSGA